MEADDQLLVIIAWLEISSTQIPSPIMAEMSFYLLKLSCSEGTVVDSLHHKIDAYGFALRPQHLQTYQQYADLYKEEEEERSNKWKLFLEQQAKSADLCKSEKEDKETLHVETEASDQTLRDSSEKDDVNSSDLCSFEKEDKATSPVEVSKKTLETASERSEEVESVDSCSAEDGDKKVLHAEKPGETETAHECSSDTEDTKTLHTVDVSSQISGNTAEKVGEEEVADLQSPEKDDKEIVKVVISEQIVGTNSESVGERDDAAVSTRNGSSGCSLEKEVRSAKHLKVDKVKKWASIRPVLGAIENMMSFRVKKSKYMEDAAQRISRTEKPPPVEDTRPPSETLEEGELEVDLVPKKKIKSSPEELNKRELKEPLFPWKDELECLVQGGVPKDLRGELWQAFVGVRARRMEKYYQALLSMDFDSENGQMLEESSETAKKWKRQIEKDLPRTFPGHPALDEHGRNSLRRVLVAYARHNPSVGYCQAMNFFAGLLLLLMPEENAFWTLIGIIDDYFDGYFTEEMIESQVDQLVFEELVRERLPRLVNHLDYLGVQVAWISGPWFLSIFINMVPWESVLRIWDVLLFQGNRVMLFRTALALLEIYGPALVTTKDAGDAITMLQSLAGSTFDSSQLVLTASMGFLAVTEDRLQKLRDKHRPSILDVIEERTNKGRVSKDSKGLAKKLYSFKHGVDEGPEKVLKRTDRSHLESPSLKLDDLPVGLGVEGEIDSVPDLQEQVVWLKVELCKLLEEKRSAILRAEELETALEEMVKQDNRRELTARVEQLEREVAELRKALSYKTEHEAATIEILMQADQEHKSTEDARAHLEKDSAAQRQAMQALQVKYDKAVDSLAQMEKRAVMAETMLEATVQYESGHSKALSSPRAVRNLSPTPESPPKRSLLTRPFGLGWLDRSKGKAGNTDDHPSSPLKRGSNGPGFS